MSEEAQSGFFNVLKEVDGKLNVHVYLGNHDYAELDSHTMLFFFELQKAKVFKTVHFYDKEHPTIIEGVRVNILPYPLTKPTSKKPSVCFAHYEVAGSIRDNGRKNDGGEEHKHGKHVFIQGHLHTRQVVRKQHFYGGTLYQTSFGESLPKGFIEFKAKTLKSTVDFRHKFVDNDPAFKLINLRVYQKKDLKQIENNPLYKYKLLISEDVDLRESDLEPFQNIVNRLSFSDEAEAQALEYAEFVLETQEIDLSTKEVLNDYLVKVKKLDSKQVKRCALLLESRFGK
jgi:hypothetical protein